MPVEPFLTEKDWRNLLRDIHNRQVIPVAGPELATIKVGENHLPLYRAIAPQLAQALGVQFHPARHTTINRVACDHLIADGARKEIYEEIREIVDQLPNAPAPALDAISSITDFDLFISTSFDPMLSRALEKRRPGFIPKRHVLQYHFNKPVDIPEQFQGALVYHLLGSHNTYPDFAVWSEDYLEFICGLLQHQDQLQQLFLLLRNRYLLLLGAPFSDWVVRFFLRAAKGERFTDRRQGSLHDYLADRPENLGDPMIFFFDKVVGATRIIPGDPAAFAQELAHRWSERYLGEDTDDPLAQMPDAMPRDSIFISYSGDDLEAVKQLVRGLRCARVPVWVDKQRLQAGGNFHRNLEFAVKEECSFFLSVISKATEKDPERFVHQERQWAAERHVDGFVFYVPIVIDDLHKPSKEPAKFSHIHYERLANGSVSAGFANRMVQLINDFRVAGRPRE